MINIFLMPQNFGEVSNDGDYTFPCQEFDNYLHNPDNVLGIPITLPAVPRINDIVSLDTLPEDYLFEVVRKAYIEHGNGAVQEMIDTYREGCEHLSEEEIIRELCRLDNPLTNMSFYCGWWRVTEVLWVVNSDTVVVVIKHEV